MQRFVAIDNVCAWPNLTALAHGTLIATIFNQPTHGGWEGDVECWASADGGLTWNHRGTPTRHQPGCNRMNVGAGTSADGDLIVLASGWTGRGEAGAGESAVAPGHGAQPRSPCRFLDFVVWTQNLFRIEVWGRVSRACGSSAPGVIDSTCALGYNCAAKEGP